MSPRARPVPLTGGSYTARNIIANAQRCLNLYPEANPKDSPFPFTYYPTPGKVLLASPPVAGPARCAYRASDGTLYYVVGPSIYLVSNLWAFSLVGTITSTTGICYIQDNGLEAVLVDGTSAGYTWQLSAPSTTFTTISDPAWYGATRVDTVDTFLVFNRPYTNQWYSTLSNQVTPLDSLYIASKTAYPDPISTLIVMHREIWLIGTQTTEVWYDAGNAQFPFSIIPGVFIEHGCCAPYSIAKHDLELFWLSQDKDGQATVLNGAKYGAQKISTPAIEYEFSTYPTVSDAIGMTYLQSGHVFYVLTFPSADKTWVFDRSQGLWHERCWLDSQGFEHRDRASVMAFVYGTNVAGDWQNGNLYALSLSAYTDAGNPIKRQRSWPHMVAGGARVQYFQFLADMAVGASGGDNGQDPGPDVWLDWSDTKGKTWGQPVVQTLGATGEYYTQLQWNRLGLARDRVFRLTWSAPVSTALQGAYVDAFPLDT